MASPIGGSSRSRSSRTLADTGSAGALATAGQALVPPGEPLFAQVSPGNVASLHLLLATGFTPVGSEVLLLHAGIDQPAARKARRKATGVVPRQRPKWCRRVAALPKPTWLATRSIGSLVSSSRCWARRTRWPGEPVVRCRPGRGAEAPRERTGGQVDPSGELVDGELLLEVLGHPLEQRLDRVVVAGRHRQVDELRLATVAVRRHDHAPGDRVRHRAALVLAHDVQAEVDAGCGPGAGEDVAVLDVEHVRLELAFG